jgi:two-component system phosphate regulon sensor histidine kinase PhoR
LPVQNAHFPISEAGIWADPIRQRKPVIIDDYSVQIPHKKGVPEGHVEIKRFLGVPVFEKEHIVAIAAVANKKECYDKQDVSLVTSLVTDMWRLIQRKKVELELKQYNEILERVGEGIEAGLAVISRDYRVVWANKRLMDLGVAPNKKWALS